jgi:hypothetical protein
MKATMSSLSESKLSVLIVKHPFSQMGPGWGQGVKENIASEGGRLWAAERRRRKLGMGSAIFASAVQQKRSLFG